MTVHMSNGDQQNVDPENNSTIPSTEEMDTTHLESVQGELVTVESHQSCSQSCVQNSEQDNSSHLANDLHTANDALLNGAHDDCIVASEANFDNHTKFQSLLAEVEDAISKPRWALSIIPCKEFDTLLDMSLDMIKNGQYEFSQLCQNFVTDTIIKFFIKFYSDDIIDSIKPEVIKLMLSYSFKIIEVIVLNFDKENFKLLDLLSIVFSPSSKFCMLNGEKLNNMVYAKKNDIRFQRNILIGLINHFGFLGGFEILLSCFRQNNLSIYLILSYLKPFSSSSELLTQETIESFFLPILQIVPEFIENLEDDVLKKEAKNDKSDNISIIIKTLKNFAMRLPNCTEFVQSLELLKLKVILRLLQVSSFNGKMNALNELNKVITSCSNEEPGVSSEFFLSSESMAQWLVENKVLEIVLKDCLHQPQYVEKLENIIRFLIKKNTLSLDYLDIIWNSQIEKHEIIVKNVHDLIAKLAWSFSSDQLNHLFVCFQSSWANASKKEREKLLELMRRLAEDDKDGSMAHKVLTLLWDIAYSDDVDIDIIDQALIAHFKILDYCRTYDKDTQKVMWLKKCITELENTDCKNSVLPAMKHIREICKSFPSPSLSSANKGKSYGKQKCKVTNRHEVLSYLQDQYSFVALIANNLSLYMKQVRTKIINERLIFDPDAIYNGRRFSHHQEVQERLNFLKFVLQEGQLWLCLMQANEIWNCLACNSVCKIDTQMCFRWFTSLVDSNSETDLDPEMFSQFFETNILKLDQTLVDINGIECFQKFFLAVNCQQSKLILRNKYYMNDSDLVGLDYLWKLILFCDDDAAQKAINLLIEVYTNLGPNLMSTQVDLHFDLINTCFDRLKASYDTIHVIEKDPTQSAVINTELRKMTRVLSVLQEYIFKCDNDFSQERIILPMSQSYRGKQVFMSIKILNFGRNPDDLELWTHTNESLVAIRKKILSKLKLMHNVEIEFCNMGEKIDLSTSKLVSHLQFTDKLNLTARLSHSSTNISSSEYELNTIKKNNLLHKHENNLPGVMISKKAEYFSFLFKFADIAISLNYFPLQEKCLSLLKLIPPDVNLVQFVRNLCKNTLSNDDAVIQIESELFSSPTKTVYLLGIIYSLLFPTNNPLSMESQEFQKSFITSKCALRILSYLNIKNSFLAKADNFYKICAISIILKICKFVLSTLSYLKMFCLKSSTNLNEALHQAPKDFILRKISMNTAQNIYNIFCGVGKKSNNLACDNTIDLQNDSNLSEVMNYHPNMELISSIITIAFATATGSFEFLNSDFEYLHQYFSSETNLNHSGLVPLKLFDSYDVCKESFEVLTVIFMLSPNDLRDIINNENWQNFFIDLLLVCNETSIRTSVMEQFTLIITKCVQNEEILNDFINLLFKHLQTLVPNYFKKSHQFFQLFCNLVNYAFQINCSILTINDLLKYEISLLRNARSNFIQNEVLEEIQLEGHLKITKELIMLLNPEEKFKIGSNFNGQSGFIDFLMDEYIFTASKSLYLLQNNVNDIDEIDPICSTSNTLVAAYELLVSLCTGCSENLEQVADTLETYSSNLSINDWEYYPFMGTRPYQSFVGLKNAGATCYMNSVLQQLFMIPEIRNGILSVNTGTFYFFDENLNEEPYFNQITNEIVKQEDNNSYNIGILKQLQTIFGHLLLSKCQYYVPKGFWQQFKLFGGPINLREQHDALEFFNSLVDSLDEALKSQGQIPIMSHIFGGTFADQKICKGCPHRYSREESFTTLNVDVRNHNSLIDSLEQYVKGDLLEGDNAYYCEKCDRKVDTVKRLCIKKLPKILAIQLKRFDYDYERESAIKFNDYFEFPRILDMQPYTVNGLAQMEGEVIEDDLSSNQVDNTQYELNGIVVHSGQASGGHYYSFILHNDGFHKKWYKFDDGDVNEWKLDEDEEMRNQCFGGEYVGEVFDQMLKKMSHRTQKRWWNAFILVYRKISTDPLNNHPIQIDMPLPIKKNVQRQNIRFLHQRNQFSEEFYYFMRRLIQCNKKSLNSNSMETDKLEKIIYTTLNLASRFLFLFCFRTKKSLRNNAIEWYEDLIPYLKTNCSIRHWFIKNHLLENSNLFCELLLECPSPDVRLAFSKIIVFLVHYALIDKTELSSVLADRIMEILIRLLKKEVSDYSSHLSQFFNMFYLFATLGMEERTHLLHFNIPLLFMLLATDEGPGYPIKYQYIELGKLYQVVSLLIRCCDISEKSVSFNPDQTPLANPFRHEENHANYIMPIQSQVYEIMFMKKKYLKKIIKDGNTLEDTSKLLKFCCWEQPSFSLSVLTEILCHISNSYTYELRPYFDLLHQLLIVNDSWQDHRINTAFSGDSNAEGIFDIMQNHTVHLEKRAYQCIKFLVNLFSTCEKALIILKENRDFKVKWANAVSWLNDCLHFPSMPYGHYNNNNNNNNNWNSVPSNETSNSYALERSNSATLTLSKAEEILTEEDLQNDCEYTEEEDEEEDESAHNRHYTNNNNNNNNEMEESLSNEVSNITITSDNNKPTLPTDTKDVTQ